MPGVNMQFLVGNEGYWRTRYEPSADGSHTAVPHARVLQGDLGQREDRSERRVDGNLARSAVRHRRRAGRRPENAVSGTMYMVNHDDLAGHGDRRRRASFRLWRNTALASLAAGDRRDLAPHTVGYESNEDIDNGFRPHGLIRLSTTTGPTPQYLTDYGNTVVAGHDRAPRHALPRRPAARSSSRRRASSGAGASTRRTTATARPRTSRMQQAQVNLFADMGAQPGSLMTGLVAAADSPPTRCAPTDHDRLARRRGRPSPTAARSP